MSGSKDDEELRRRQLDTLVEWIARGVSWELKKFGSCTRPTLDPATEEHISHRVKELLLKDD